jgi:hypothetical protein
VGNKKSICFGIGITNTNTLVSSIRNPVPLILPEGLLEYFELIDVHLSEHGQLKIYLEEKNLAPSGYEKPQLESKGFLPETAIQGFPIRGHKVALCIKRRRWEILETGAVITRDWNLVRKGARMTTEFGTFLKGIFG